MPRIKAVDPATATGEAKKTLDAVQQKMGRVPNIFQLMANSPAAVQGYLNFSEALSKGLLDPQVRERIAIVCAETNHCQYCLSAHVAIGKAVGLSDDELTRAREIRSADPKTTAALTFVRNLILRRADLPNDDLELLREAGFTDGEICEIVANVALNIFTNYFNHIAQTEVDFPKVELAFPV